MKRLDKWFVDFCADDGTGEAWAVVHFIGGEDGHYVHNYYDSESEAKKVAAELGDSEVYIEWEYVGNDYQYRVTYS